MVTSVRQSYSALPIVEEVDVLSPSPCSEASDEIQMRELDLVGRNLSDEEMIQKIRENAPFKSIILSNQQYPVRSIGSKVFSVLVKECPCLKFIGLSGCESVSDEDVSILAKGAEHLRGIDLSGAVNLTDQAVFCLSIYCKNLLHLTLSCCKQIGDSAISALKVGCCYLTLLDVSGCNLLSESGIGILATVGSRLSTLRLDSCDGAVSDSSIEILVKSCPELEVLDLSNCFRFTDKSLAMLGRYCKKLRIVDFSSCTHACTEKAILDLLKACPDLSALNLYACKQISHRVLNLLISLKSTLKAINVSGCPLFTDYSALSRLPNLIYLVLGHPDRWISLPKISSNKLIVNHEPPSLIRFSQRSF